MLYNTLLPWYNKSAAGIEFTFKKYSVPYKQSFRVDKQITIYPVPLLTYFWKPFSTNKSEIHQEIESENLCQQKYEERLKEEDFGDSKYGLLRKYLWNLTEYPETSLAAQVIGKQKMKRL